MCCSISVPHLDITALIRRIKPISKSGKTDVGVLGARCRSALMTRLPCVVPSLSRSAASPPVNLAHLVFSLPVMLFVGMLLCKVNPVLNVSVYFAACTKRRGLTRAHRASIHTHTERHTHQEQTASLGLAAAAVGHELLLQLPELISVPLPKALFSPSRP